MHLTRLNIQHTKSAAIERLQSSCDVIEAKTLDGAAKEFVAFCRQDFKGGVPNAATANLVPSTIMGIAGCMTGDMLDGAAAWIRASGRASSVARMAPCTAQWSNRHAM
jgi:hypothetical protein